MEDFFTAMNGLRCFKEEKSPPHCKNRLPGKVLHFERTSGDWSEGGGGLLHSQIRTREGGCQEKGERGSSYEEEDNLLRGTECTGSKGGKRGVTPGAWERPLSGKEGGNPRSLKKGPLRRIPSSRGKSASTRGGLGHSLAKGVQHRTRFQELRRGGGVSEGEKGEPI